MSAILATIWPYLLGAFGLVGAWYAARRSGVKAERNKQNVKRLEAAKETSERINNAKPAKNAATARANLVERLRRRGK